MVSRNMEIGPLAVALSFATYSPTRSEGKEVGLLKSLFFLFILFHFPEGARAGKIVHSKIPSLILLKSIFIQISGGRDLESHSREQFDNRDIKTLKADRSFVSPKMAPDAP